jgi:hypothetical protein
VFLDLREDRYFCLPREANGAFLRLARNECLQTDSKALDPLVKRGVLVKGDARRPIQSPAAIEVPQSDFSTEPGARAGALNTIRTLSSELRTAWLLKRSPLHEVIEGVRRIRPGIAPVSNDRHRLASALVKAAAATAFILRSHDRCLVRGLAFHSSCRKRGLNSKLVLGVIAHPFTAHCWVQLGNVVLVGGYEQARLYTPILVLE